MKKNVIVICLILICGTQLFAQKKWFVSFNTGYALKMSSQNLYNEDLEFYFYNSNRHYDGEDQSSYGTDEQINTSIGKGFNFSLSGGYMFNENFGIEMGFSYLMGGKTLSNYEYYSKQIYYDDNWNPVSYDYSHCYENAISSKMFRMNPSLLFNAGNKTINPYAKVGLIIGIGSILYERTELYEDEYDNQNDQTSIKFKMNGGISFGCSAALGLNYNIGKNIALFGEVHLISMSYSPKKGTIIEYTENGKNELNELTTSEKEINFVNEFDYSSDDNESDYKPTTMLQYKFPFSSFGFNVGVKIKF
ncbi:MAG: hypothetical protein H6Q25_1375 [Bacteroidetes bacterium]|nr:hypothetical protein [Bacteroidota bacterium]